MTHIRGPGALLPATGQPHRGRLRIGLHMAGGLGVVGAAGYAFVSITGHVFTGAGRAADVAALTSLYLVANIIGPGIFTALEQETSRAASTSIATGHSIGAVTRRAAWLAGALFVAVTAVLVALWPGVLSHVLNNREGLLGAAVLAAAGSALAYWARGLLSGQHRFGRYATTLYVEGSARLVACLMLLGLAVRVPEAYGVAFAIGAGAGGLAGLRRGRSAPAAPAAGQLRGMGGSVAFLVSATLLMQLMANLGPVVVAYRLPADPVGVSVFAATFVLARLPLFLFSPLQVVLVPSLTRAVTNRAWGELRRRVVLVLLAVVAVAGVGAVLTVFFGPWAVRVLLGAAYAPTAGTVAVLALATTLMMVAQILQPALIALRRQVHVMVAWAVGAAAFLGVLLAPLEPVTAALAAQIIGPAVVVICAGTTFVVALRNSVEQGQG